MEEISLLLISASYDKLVDVMSSSRAILLNCVQVRGGSRLVQLVRLSCTGTPTYIRPGFRAYVGRGKEGVPEKDYEFRGTGQNFSREERYFPHSL